VSPQGRERTRRNESFDVVFDIDHQAVLATDEEELAARLKPVYDRLAHQHPLIAAAQSHPIGGALRFCDVPGGDGFTETDLYREFFVPFGLRYQLVIRLPSPPDVIVGHALNRQPDQGEFSDRDVAVLNALGPHLAMHHRHTVDLQRTGAMAAEVDRGGGWTVLTVRSDEIVGASSSRSSSSSFTRGGRVPQNIIDLLPSYGDVPLEPHTHDIMIGVERWRCVVHPVPVGPSVLLARRLGDEPAAATPLTDIGLTRRQTAVAIALAESGGTNSQLARALDISESTLKKHLETVFRALAVDSRAAAVAALRSMIG
jgi:DNA-binding CsgD family transcriptional regulator